MSKAGMKPAKSKGFGGFAFTKKVEKREAVGAQKDDKKDDKRDFVVAVGTGGVERCVEA